MLGRRHYRIKVFQALYAWFQGGETRQDVAEKNLLQSIDKIFELYYLQLSFFLEVIGFYRIRSEDAKNKFLPTEEELNPNMKLIENSCVISLQQNRDLQKQFNTYRFSWTEEQEMVRKIYNKVRNLKDLKEYLNKAEVSFEDDRDIVYRIFKKCISKSPELQFYCEERNIFWIEDYQSAALFILKTIKQIPEGFPESKPLSSLFPKDDDDDPKEDRKFIGDLFKKTIAQSDKLEELIRAKTKNWELERIALTDIILIKMALTELMQFPSIPVKVTMNEYIELSKLFSTPKSKMFINGLLDKLVEDLKKEKKIKKKGRGLL
ncbi:MAG: transcription antitermination factor NusB [Bacteroidetes bacterium]|nr:transcription antitermination factor NusB [Bacteroidota bacterium]